MIKSLPYDTLGTFPYTDPSLVTMRKIPKSEEHYFYEICQRLGDTFNSNLKLLNELNRYTKLKKILNKSVEEIEEFHSIEKEVLINLKLGVYDMIDLDLGELKKPFVEGITLEKIILQ